LFTIDLFDLLLKSGKKSPRCNPQKHWISARFSFFLPQSQCRNTFFPRASDSVWFRWLCCLIRNRRQRNCHYPSHSPSAWRGLSL